MCWDGVGRGEWTAWKGGGGEEIWDVEGIWW